MSEQDNVNHRFGSNGCYSRRLQIVTSVVTYVFSLTIYIAHKCNEVTVE